jgi:hypothetical protein
MRFYSTDWLIAASLSLLVGGAGVAPAGAQEEAAVMIAAGRWAQERLPEGPLRLDPHRTGEGAGQALAEEVARALGAQLASLEETRICGNPMDASTCRLESAALLAMTMPRIRRDEATLRVYAWHRTGSAREPVGRETWNLRLTRTATGWVVSGEGS